MKVLLAVDGSDYSRRMLDYVAGTELLGPAHAYTAVTVVVGIPPHAARYIDHDTLAEYYRDEAREVLEPLQQLAAERGLKLATVHRHGHAADEIAALAQSGDFDLVVMGTHGHSALGRLVLGSVTTGFLARARTPLLLVP
ncbi:MAG: universal stress protein [Caldimonas sp.]